MQIKTYSAFPYAMCFFALGMFTVVEAEKSPDNNERKRIAAAGLCSEKFSDRSIVFWYS